VELKEDGKDSSLLQKTESVAQREFQFITAEPFKNSRLQGCKTQRGIGKKSLYRGFV
jgi:hypothetical protein